MILSIVNLSLILFFLLSILLILILVIVIKKINIFNARSLIIFKINKKRQVLIRLNQTSTSKKMLNPNYGINTIEKYYDLSNFLNLLDIESRKIIQNYFNQNQTLEKLNLEVNFNNIKTNDFTNFLFKNLKIKQKKTWFLKIFPNVENENEYFCSLMFKNKLFKRPKNLIKVLNNEKEFENRVNANNYASIFVINFSHWLNLENKNDLIQKIANFLKLKNNKYLVSFHKNFLFFYQEHKRINQLKKCRNKNEKKVTTFYQEQNIYLNADFNLITYLEKDSKENFNNLFDKIDYLMFNLINNQNHFLYSIWDLENDFTDFTDFQIKKEIYETKNKTNNFSQSSFPLKKYDDGALLNINYINLLIPGLGINDLIFFNNIPYYRNKFMFLWNQFIIENNKAEKIYFNSSIQTIFKDINKYNNSNLNLILKVPKNLDELKEFFDNLKLINKNSYNIVLYIDYINEYLINYLRMNLVNSLIISSKLTREIKFKNDIYIKIFNLNQILNNHWRIIYENIDLNLDSDTIKKLNIKYYLDMQ
ncbi:MHO_4530 family protein [Mycoplasmopsis gallinarum]|uniref:MHO_4530 family protein n=1 Tax=Mycoplasmopsis gallinarum TaxID=29557 RepID=UPI00047F6257|nr:hypothetical protein [Mycoplasmopsis gallinarum]